MRIFPRIKKHVCRTAFPDGTCAHGKRKERTMEHREQATSKMLLIDGLVKMKRSNCNEAQRRMDFSVINCSAASWNVLALQLSSFSLALRFVDWNSGIWSTPQWRDDRCCLSALWHIWPFVSIPYRFLMMRNSHCKQCNLCMDCNQCDR